MFLGSRAPCAGKMKWRKKKRKIIDSIKHDLNKRRGGVVASIKVNLLQFHCQLIVSFLSHQIADDRHRNDNPHERRACRSEY